MTLPFDYLVFLEPILATISDDEHKLQWLTTLQSITDDSALQRAVEELRHSILNPPMTFLGIPVVVDPDQIEPMKFVFASQYI